MWGFGEEVLPGCFPRGLTDAISWTDTDDTASTMNGRDGLAAAAALFVLLSESSGMF